MPGSKSTYGQIFKSTSLFGGVQLLQILISIVRSKLVAVLLGPAGMGISGLLTSTTSLIESLTNLGLATSAIRDVAEASEHDDKARISRMAYIVQRMATGAALLGALVTSFFSGQLSQLTFGNTDYRVAFIWLSISILLNQLASGQSAILRGLRSLRWMAKASLFGSLFGLLGSIPMYYFYGEKGIVPAIVITSVFSFAVTAFYCRKIGIRPEAIPAKDVLKSGKRMLVLGFLLSMSSLISMGASYLVRLFINWNGSIGDVGLYNAGFAIINSYVGMVFTAMGVDYFPRLAKIAGIPAELNRSVNEQAEVAVLILAPVLCVFIVLINWVILLFYSTVFLPINEMMQWAAFGMLFKAVSWAIGFIILAKGDSRVFFWTELTANVYITLLNLAGYWLGGLSGLGIAFFSGYLLYLVHAYITCRIFYGFEIHKEVYRLLLLQLLLVGICFAVTYLETPLYRYVSGILFACGSLLLSLYYLNRRVDLRSYLSKFLAWGKRQDPYA